MEIRNLAAVFFLLASACAPRELQRPVGTGGFLGAGLCPVDAGVEVVKVAPGSPAEKAKIRRGDVIVSYGGAALAAADRRQALLRDIRALAGQKLPVELKRGDETVSAALAPAVRDFYPQDELFAALSDEIVTGRRVSVAVVVTDVNHTKPEFFDDAPALEAWRSAMRGQLANSFEGLLLNKTLLRCGNYSVADRDKTDQVLKELGFHMTGAVSPETTKEVGKLAGASHLLFVSFTRFQQPSGAYEDDSSVRLVAVETDSVLASLRFRRLASRD
jgi:membrane-associated protease RseP (regulator of RpoE activity)